MSNSPSRASNREDNEVAYTTPPSIESQTPTKNRTVEKVMHSVNVVLENSPMVSRVAEVTALHAQSMISTYLPQVLDYLPEKKIGKEYTFLIMLLCLLMTLFWCGAARTLVDIAGVLFPLYASVLTVESKDKAETRQWLAYWIVYVMLRFVDNFAWGAITWIFPLYPLFKLLFLAWLYHPDFNGARCVHTLMRPYIIKFLLWMDPHMHGNTTAAKETLLGMRDSNASKQNESIGSFLVVHVQQVTVKSEKNMYVECTVLPNKGRAPAGIEGTCYKTSKVLGTTCAFNHFNTFLPLPMLDGVLKVEALEKPTFNEAISLGVVEISLLDITPGAPRKEMAVTMTGEEGATINMSLELGFGTAPTLATTPR